MEKFPVSALRRKCASALRRRVAAVCCAAAAFGLSSCNDWTQTESLDIDQPSIEELNPELYAQYLESLRNYKATDHKVLFTWFDNVPVATSRAHHLTVVPDSVDAISLLNPRALTNWQVEEMEKVRKKGTAIYYTVACPEVERLYDEYLEAWKAEHQPETGEEADAAEEGEMPAPKSFSEIAGPWMDEMLSLCDASGFDGISLWYEGKSTLHMTEEERAEYLARQDFLLAKVTAWIAAHPQKSFVFEGTPQYVTDRSLLASAKYIVIRTTAVTTAYGLTAAVLATLRDEVPDDRFIVMVEPFPLDEGDATTGRFSDASGQLTLRAITEAAFWTTEPDGIFGKAGMGIYDIQNDYYNTSLIYKYTREAISILNPAPKN